MTLSLQDLTGDLDVRLVAGAAGLGRDVRWVHISELLDPTPFLSGGELLLTTGLQLATRGRQREYVARLVEAGIAGLGLGVGFAHDTVPGALLQAAEAAGFPLFEIPYDVPFIAITEKAAAHIVNAHYAVLQRAIGAHERLERIVLGDGGLPGIVAALSELVSGSATIFDARGELMAGDAPDSPVAAAVRDRIGSGARRGFAAERALALPVARTPPSNGHAPVPQAWLVASKGSGALSELDRLILHQAVTIVALELLRRRVAHDTERRLAGDVLSGLLSGDLAGGELSRRLEPFGLRQRVGVVVFAPTRGRRDDLEEALSAALEEEGRGGMIASAGAHTCVLLPGAPEGEEEFALAERLRARVSVEIGVQLPAGAGRAVGPDAVRRSFHEARCAIDSRAMSGANGSAPPALLVTYRDLGSFALLLSLQDADALRLFCDSILSPVERGDGAYGGELTHSLEVFIECNGQWERAARQLYCHRHTLRYRIRRVEELTGRSLDSARDRIEFWLALRGRELTR